MEQLLGDDAVMLHPFVIGEIALGSLRNRQRTLAELETIPVAPMVAIEDVLELIEGQKLAGSGIGLDRCSSRGIHSAGCDDLSWTKDRRLVAVRSGSALKQELPESIVLAIPPVFPYCPPRIRSAGG